ncbi:MAG: hypothetical protein H0X69_07235 [Gemmatimonadales bacterium]|nr:hypothetical protein [Gemmatimonadales bacterium]
MPDESVLPTEPSPAETSGLRGARLAARVRQALYNLPAADLAAAHERMREGGTRRHLEYFHDGRVEAIRVLPCPITLLPEQLVYLHSVTRTLHYALLRMPELYLGDPAVHDLLRLDPVEDEWLHACWTPAVKARNPVFDRLDCMVDYASPIWKDTLRFVEPNLTGVGGLYLVPAVEEVVEEAVVPLLVSQDPGIRLTRLLDARTLLLHELMEHLEVVGRPGGTICLVEPKYELEGIDEQRRLAEYFGRRHGIRVLHADPSELRMKGDEVYCGDRQVDLVYRDYAVLDLVELAAGGMDPEPMRRLFRENRVVSSITAELDCKSCFEVLTDPVLSERYYSEEERRVFQHHVLWTRVVGDRKTSLPSGEVGDLLEFARREREWLVLKPSRGYGGDGVLLGQTVGEGEWVSALDAALADEELWVVQRLAQIPVVEVPTLTTDGTLHPEAFYHVMGFASSDSGIAILARASQRQVVNVAQHGGMAAVMVVEEA